MSMKRQKIVTGESLEALEPATEAFVVLKQQRDPVHPPTPNEVEDED